uniref:Uncharacterized protein n=1 Tax=Romanomermis culicivorax TaxID=13658 RepID=A0A915IYY5_ROMCU
MENHLHSFVRLFFDHKMINAWTTEISGQKKLSPKNGTLTGTTNSHNIFILILLLFLIITDLPHLAQDGVDYRDQSPQISSSVTVVIIAVGTSQTCSRYHLQSNVLLNVKKYSVLAEEEPASGGGRRVTKKQERKMKKKEKAS